MTTIVQHFSSTRLIRNEIPDGQDVVLDVRWFPSEGKWVWPEMRLRGDKKMNEKQILAHYVLDAWNSIMRTDPYIFYDVAHGGNLKMREAEALAGEILKYLNAARNAVDRLAAVASGGLRDDGF